MGLRRNASYEEQLRKEFGLQYGNEGWAFEGYELSNPVPDWNSPHLWFQALLTMKEKMSFTKICFIVDIKPMVCILNTQPFPFAIKIGFSQEQAAELIATVMARGNTDIIEYGDIFVLTLS